MTWQCKRCGETEHYSKRFETVVKPGQLESHDVTLPSGIVERRVTSAVPRRGYICTLCRSFTEEPRELTG